jgi:uncharacterized protein YybS (DUF2232 family)
MRRDIATGILITGLIVAACATIPVAGMLCAVFIPVPIMGYRVKTGRYAAAFIATVVLALVGWLGGGPDVLFFGALLLIGFLLAEMALAGYSLERTALLTGAAVLAAGWTGLMAFGAASGTGAYALVADAVRVNLELTLAIYKEMGVAEDQVGFIADSIDTIQQVLVWITPALALGFALLVIWISLLLAPFFFRRIGLAAPNYGALDHWKAPDILVWLAIASGVLLLVPGFSAKILGLNGLLVLMVVYFFQGIAIVAFFFRKKRVPRAARIILYGMIFVQQLIMLAVIGAGFFDTWFNFRRLGKPLAPTEAE